MMLKQTLMLVILLGCSITKEPKQPVPSEECQSFKEYYNFSDCRKIYFLDSLVQHKVVVNHKCFYEMAFYLGQKSKIPLSVNYGFGGISYFSDSAYYSDSKQWKAYFNCLQ